LEEENNLFFKVLPPGPTRKITGQENVTIQSAATIRQCSQHQQPQSAVTSMDAMDEALCLLSPEAERNLGVAVRKDF
jgi:hypothetical protein